jgi:molecular chaperone GrpE (heat shock protein)
MDTREDLYNRVANLQRDNLTSKNNLEEFEKSQEKRIDGIFNEFLSVIDTFDRAEQAIKERGLDQDENAKKAINRLLNAKKKALAVLGKFDIKRIEFEDGHSVPEQCSVVDTEPDPNRETGEIISIERQGYTRRGNLLRPAEVVIVKN